MDVGFADMMQVLESWQAARRREDFEEQLGIDTLMLMFELDLEIQEVFGFSPNKKITGLQRMGLLIHGSQVVKVFDAIFSALGPDIDDVLVPILEDLGDEHLIMRLSPEHFQSLSKALMQVLPEKLDGWSPALKESWTKVMNVVIGQLAECVRNRNTTKPQKPIPSTNTSNVVVKSRSVAAADRRLESRIINTV